MRVTIDKRGWVVLGVLAGVGVLGVAACVGDSTTPPPVDAGIDVQVGVDAAPDVVADTSVDAGPACDKTKPFGSPEVLLATPNVSEDGFWLSSDQRTAYASINGADGGLGSYDLFTLSRASATDPWGSALTPLKLNSAGMERGPVVSENGLELYFYKPTTVYDLYVATRPSTAQEFGTPAGSPLNTTDSELPTWISKDGLALYIQSNRAGTTGGDDIWRAQRGDSTSPFGAPVLVPGVNSTSGDGSGVLSSDELEIFFASIRPGGKGSLDIYRATRSTKNDGFGTPTLVSELNSSNIDFPV